jgi:hypothetical protein
MKTKRELFKEIYDKYGLQSGAIFHSNLDEEISDQEYDNQLGLMKKISEINWDDLENDESDDL